MYPCSIHKNYQTTKLVNVLSIVATKQLPLRDVSQRYDLVECCVAGNKNESEYNQEIPNHKPHTHQ